MGEQGDDLGPGVRGRPRDARPDDSDIARVGSLNPDDAAFPNETSPRNEDDLGRLLARRGRSVSGTGPGTGYRFNASDGLASAVDTRSDGKGSEPEGWSPGR